MPSFLRRLSTCPSICRHTQGGPTLAAAMFVLLASSACMAQPRAQQTYEPSDQIIANPERGMYVQFTARGRGEPLEVEQLAALRDDHITLILRLYYLNAYRDAEIDDAYLELIQQDLDTMREAGVKCILRFAYNEKIGDPDAAIDVVVRHMEQLKPVLSENADVIAVAQAGFVGSWGEWHASTNDLREPENAQRIIKSWLDILPATRFVQVRTPIIKHMLVETDAPLTQAEAFDGDGEQAFRGRIAHHNDCFLATDTDMGTYQDIPAEKAYLEKETRFLPMGGETCHVSEYNEESNARQELQRFHWSYLHRDYHPDVIDGWRDSGFLEEVEKHLGYRLVLTKASAFEQAPAGGVLEVQLEMLNTGWAAPYNPRGVELVLRSQDDGALHHAALNTHPRLWLPGTSTTLDAKLQLRQDLAPGQYDVLLWLPDPEPALRHRADYAIQLANDDLWDANTGWHDLGLTVQVEAPKYGTDTDIESNENTGVFVPMNWPE